MENVKELSFNGITKQSEKAVCLNLMVSWNGNCRPKDIWFPKSVVTFVTFTDKNGKERTNAKVASWFISKLERTNVWNGYEMRFETIFE